MNKPHLTFSRWQWDMRPDAKWKRLVKGIYCDGYQAGVIFRHRDPYLYIVCIGTNCIGDYLTEQGAKAGALRFIERNPHWDELYGMDFSWTWKVKR